MSNVCISLVTKFIKTTKSDRVRTPEQLTCFGCRRTANPEGAGPRTRRRWWSHRPRPRRLLSAGSPGRPPPAPAPPRSAPAAPLCRHPGLNAAKGGSRPPSLPMTRARAPPPQPIPGPAAGNAAGASRGLPRGVAEAAGDVTARHCSRGAAVNGFNRHVGGRSGPPAAQGPVPQGAPLRSLPREKAGAAKGRAGQELCQVVAVTQPLLSRFCCCEVYTALGLYFLFLLFFSHPFPNRERQK